MPPLRPTAERLPAKLAHPFHDRILRFIAGVERAGAVLHLVEQGGHLAIQVRMVLEPRDQIRGAFWRDGGRVHPIEPCRPQRYLSSVMSVNSSPATYPPIPNASFASLFLSFSIAADFTFNYTPAETNFMHARPKHCREQRHRLYGGIHVC